MVPSLFQKTGTLIAWLPVPTLIITFARGFRSPNVNVVALVPVIVKELPEVKFAVPMSYGVSIVTVRACVMVPKLTVEPSALGASGVEVQLGPVLQVPLLSTCQVALTIG